MSVATLALVFGWSSPLAIAAIALAWRRWGERALPVILIALVPWACASVVTAALGGAIEPIDGVVVEYHRATSKRGCAALLRDVDGGAHEGGPAALCTVCPVGGHVQKPAWSFTVTCDGRAVDAEAGTLMAVSVGFTLVALVSVVGGLRTRPALTPDADAHYRSDRSRGESQRP